MRRSVVVRGAAFLVVALLLLTALWRWGDAHRTPVDPAEQIAIDYINSYGQ